MLICLYLILLLMSAILSRALRTQTSALSGFSRRSVLRMSSGAPPAPPSAWLLKYDYVEGILEKRGPYREEHLGLANELVKQGKMLCAGPYADASGALFIFSKSQTDAIEFIEKDPYVKAGLVPSYKVVQWAVGVNGQILDQQSKL